MRNNILDSWPKLCAGYCRIGTSTTRFSISKTMVHVLLLSPKRVRRARRTPLVHDDALCHCQGSTSHRCKDSEVDKRMPARSGKIAVKEQKPKRPDSRCSKVTKMSPAMSENKVSCRCYLRYLRITRTPCSRTLVQPSLPPSRVLCLFCCCFFDPRAAKID